MARFFRALSRVSLYEARICYLRTIFAIKGDHHNKHMKHLCTMAVMNVFDRRAKRMQRNLIANLPDAHVYEYIHDEFGWRLFDRICDVKRKFNIAVELGCRRGAVAKNLTEDMVNCLYQCDMSYKLLQISETSTEVTTQKLVVDEEYLPFRAGSVDLVYDCLSLHWVNDLPGAFKQINNILCNDGVFIGAMFGGDTLFELRVALQQAELERIGGFSPHISPFTSVQDLGNLLNRTGFTMLTIDTDEMVVNYPSMMEVMFDLKQMGESNCAWSRKLNLRRDVIAAASAIYKQRYGNTDGSVPATFQVLFWIGWKPDPSQPKPAARGSGNVSLKDLGRIDEIIKQLEHDMAAKLKP